MICHGDRQHHLQSQFTILADLVSEASKLTHLLLTQTGKKECEAYWTHKASKKIHAYVKRFLPALYGELIIHFHEFEVCI